MNTTTAQTRAESNMTVDKKGKRKSSARYIK